MGSKLNIGANESYQIGPAMIPTIIDGEHYTEIISFAMNLIPEQRGVALRRDELSAEAAVWYCKGVNSWNGKGSIRKFLLWFIRLRLMDHIKTVSHHRYSTKATQESIYLNPVCYDDPLELYEPSSHDHTAARIDHEIKMQGLTGRERSILRMLSAGKKQKDISDIIGVSKPRVCQIIKEARTKYKQL